MFTRSKQAVNKSLNGLSVQKACYIILIATSVRYSLNCVAFVYLISKLTNIEVNDNVLNKTSNSIIVIIIFISLEVLLVSLQK